MPTATQPKYTYNDICETIREYHWMIRELDRLRKTQASDIQIAHETKRQRQKRERAERFESRLQFIDENIEMFQEDERVMLDCILDGMKPSDAARHLGTYGKKVTRTLDAIILRIYETQLEGEGK